MVNRQGLLEMYHQQMHGNGKHIKVQETDKSLEHSLAPFNEFLSWPKQQSDSMANAEPVLVDFSDYDMDSKHLVARKSQENEEPEKDLNEKTISESRDDGLDEVDPEPSNRPRHYEMMPKMRGRYRSPQIDAPPVVDLRREFASDEANPYVENLRQRYNPLPNPYSG
ncbi:hypothetical protein KR018_012616 [Drosophila ironensis]|nr:hypothetical protein KR018_012616 [Drosophila ironensis]